ncbi:thermonuclease family protein [Candidatus Daviesbacteria bacterium]|nr:thermonuclease family protein [Candidatus Daviesbacteria bacterium]
MSDGFKKRMSQNSRLLILFSVLIILVGSGLLWSGLKLPAIPIQQASPTPLVETVPIATKSASIDVEGERAFVKRVIDGDTIELDNGSTVRLLGIDTPETVDPRKPVQCFGKEASNKLKSLVLNQVVILQKDVSETDKYQRLLRYVLLPLDNDRLLFINDYLIREGFAKVLTIPPDVKYTEQFLEAQREARENKKGLWGRC